MKLKTLGKRLESIMQLFWGEKKLGSPVFERNIPLKQDIEARLEGKTSGVWNVRGKDKYLKFASNISCHLVRINPSDYEAPEDATQDVIRCAKFYKTLANIGFYHPDTDVVVCKDTAGYLTLMIIMPELKTYTDRPTDKERRVKRNQFRDRTGLEASHDFNYSFNWGYKNEHLYAHDLHVTFGDGRCPAYKMILEMAKKMVVK